MKVLRLGNSFDTFGAEEGKNHLLEVCERAFTGATGEPMESVVRTFWPTPNYPELVERWLDRYEPDMVYAMIHSFPVTYESVPLRLERRLGRVGKALNEGTQKLVSYRGMGGTQASHLARKALLRTIGGDTNFSVEEVLRVTEEVIRKVVAKEGVILVLRGPKVSYGRHGGTRGIARAEQRRQALNAGLRQLTAKYHVPCDFYETEPYRHDDPAVTFADALHTNMAQQVVDGTMQGEAMARAWVAAHAR